MSREQTSRHHGTSSSSRRNQRTSPKKEDDTESTVNSVKRTLTQIGNMLAVDPDEWEDYIPSARQAMASLDRISFFRQNRLPEQQWITQILQDFAYHDSDEGAIRDIADWCQSTWLRMLRDHPNDVVILTGTYHQNLGCGLFYVLSDFCKLLEFGKVCYIPLFFFSASAFLINCEGNFLSKTFHL